MYRTSLLDEAAYLFYCGHLVRQILPPPPRDNPESWRYPRYWYFEFDEDARVASRAWTHRRAAPVIVDIYRYFEYRSRCRYLMHKAKEEAEEQVSRS